MCKCKLVKELGKFINEQNDEIEDDIDIGNIGAYDVMENLECFYLELLKKVDK